MVKRINCLLIPLLILTVTIFVGCSDDIDDNGWTNIYEWEERGDLLREEATAWDSLCVFHSKEDIDRLFTTSSMNTNAYKKLSSVDYNRHNILVCWTMQHQFDILSIDMREDSIVVNAQYRKINNVTIPYGYYVAVKVGKFSLPDDRIKFVTINGN